MVARRCLLDHLVGPLQERRRNRQLGMPPQPPVQGHMRPVSKTYVTADTLPATLSRRLLQDLRTGRPGRAESSNAPSRMTGSPPTTRCRTPVDGRVGTS